MIRHSLCLSTPELLGVLACCFGVADIAQAAPADAPNIVYILADDLGYGDVRCLNPEGKIATPNIDRLATEGMRFTDAHSGSAVCTPTRYGILTGRYCWRSRLQADVLSGFSPPLIAQDRLTVPALLRRHGYVTACIGKWHLGLTFAAKNGVRFAATSGGEGVDPTKAIQNGPTTRGFDEYFGISASLDMPPFAFIENNHFTEVPSVEKTFVRKGIAAPGFDAVDVLPTLTRRAVEYIEARAADKKAFFLYLALNSPHTPIVPTKDWQNKSGLNAYGDFVRQTDASVGAVLAALDEKGLANRTLVIVTSDNGCSPRANIPELESKGHCPSYRFRGFKADIFDGGHRIPFIARWPGKIKAGATSDQLICLTDLMATCAEFLDAKLPDNAGEDSVSILPALLSRTTEPIREAVVHHSINGSFAIRQGRWKLELCSGSGGWSPPTPTSAEAKQLPPVQLYDMTADVGERANVYKEHPEIVTRLTRLLEKYIANGRSTPGAPQQNDGPVKMWKSRPPMRDDSGKVISHNWLLKRCRGHTPTSPLEPYWPVCSPAACEDASTASVRPIGWSPSPLNTPPAGLCSATGFLTHMTLPLFCVFLYKHGRAAFIPKLSTTKTK